MFCNFKFFYTRKNSFSHPVCFSGLWAKLYIPSTQNIDLILWHTQLIVCAVKFSNHGLFLSLLKLIPCPIYIELYMCSPIKLHILISKQFHLNCLEHYICISLTMSSLPPSTGPPTNQSSRFLAPATCNKEAISCHAREYHLLSQICIC